MSVKFVLAFLAAAALAPLAARADALTDSIQAIPAGIEDVRIGGTWEKDGRSGVYRLIILRSGGGDNVTARLFVQWISFHDNGDATVDTSVEVKELTDLKIDVVDYVSESDEDGLSVYLETIDPNGSADQTYELHVNSPTDYRFGPASN